MNEQLDDDEPVTGPHAEIEITDSDQDGTHDTVRSSASVVRMRNDADTDIGGMRLKAEHELDVGYANKDARLAADGGLAYQENTELGMKRQKGCVSVGPSGDRPANPWLRACGEYQLLSTENGGDLWVGHDRGRYGFSAMGGMEAQAAQGKLEAETSIPIPFTDWTLDSGVSLEGDAVSHGKSGGVAMHYDSNKQRMNWQYKIPIGWLGLDVGLNLSIGRRYPTRDLREVMASLFVATGPNVIVTGDDSVLIG